MTHPGSGELDPKRAPQLLRGVGPWAAIAVNVTNMIGAGVFLKARVMACNVGSAGAVMAVWVAAGLLALAGTFCYSELAAMSPEAGGDYVYLRRAYGRRVAFLFGWMSFTIFRTGSQAALAVGLAIFLNVALGGALVAWRVPLPPAALGVQLDGLTLTALASIWVVTLINCASVATGGRTALVATVFKVALVVAVGIGGFWLAPGGLPHVGESGFSGTCAGVNPAARGGIAGVGAAMLGALWAYDGWANIAPLAGEIRDPQRNLPRAFIGGTLLVAALYLFANASYFHALSPRDIASVPLGSSVATAVLERFLGKAGLALMAVGLVVSSFGALHSSSLTASRIPYAMARDRLFFQPLARLSPRTHVPVRALMAQGVWGSVLAVSGTYDALTDSVVFASWMFYGLTAGAVFILRRTEPDAPRPYRALWYPFLPGLFLLVTVALIVNTFIATPRQALIGVALLALGLPFYAVWSRR